MTTISDISGTTVFLANIPDIQLGEAESMDVVVVAGEVQCFNETIYCESDGFCWLRDMLSLLRPHLSAGLTEIEITVGLDVYYFNVFYCLVYIENLYGSVEDWLDVHFLTTTLVKRTTMDSMERLAVYSTENVHLTYQALYLLADGTHSTVSGQFSVDRSLYTRGNITCYDFSPSVIDYESGVEGKLLGYFIFVENRSMKFLLDPTVDDSQVSRFVYLNAFGVEEDLSLVGTLASPRQVDYTSVFLKGLRRTLSPDLQIPYRLTTATLTRDEIVSLTEMLSSESVWFGDAVDDKTLVNYSGDLTFVPTSEPGKAASAEFSFSYAFRNRRWDETTGRIVNNVFDDTFDKTFN